MIYGLSYASVISNPQISGVQTNRICFFLKRVNHFSQVNFPLLAIHSCTLASISSELTHSPVFPYNKRNLDKPFSISTHTGLTGSYSSEAQMQEFGEIGSQIPNFHCSMGMLVSGDHIPNGTRLPWQENDSMRKETSGQRSVPKQGRVLCMRKIWKWSWLLWGIQEAYLLGYSWNTYSVHVVPSESLLRSLCYPTYPADSQSVLTPILLAWNPSTTPSLHPEPRLYSHPLLCKMWCRNREHKHHGEFKEKYRISDALQTNWSKNLHFNKTLTWHACV